MVFFGGVLTAATAGWLLGNIPTAAAVAHEQHGRFVAVETGAILSPRQYRMSPAHALLNKREGGCNSGSHPCDSIGDPGEGHCCPNTHYCIINPTNITAVGCCHIGSRCDSPCPEAFYQCAHVTTVTTSGTTATLTTSGGACCPRTCTGTSEFQCPTSLGGGCCNYTQRCVANGDGEGGGGGGGQCIFDLTPSPTASIDPSLIAPPGCETGQITCAETLGGGCCKATQACTSIAGQGPRCVEDAAGPTGSGVSVVDVGGGGLSAGATAGVAVGVVVGVGALVGVAVWWWCVRRRRRRREAAAAAAVVGVGGGDGDGMGDGESSVRPRPTGVVGRVVGGSATGRSGREREMSDATSDMMSRSGRGGLAQDYFGPAPAVGPYSETHNTSPMTTPGVDRGGVPLQPHEPGDIAVPVEIDSRLREEEGQTPVGLAITPGTNKSRESEEAGGRYELYGSDIGQMSPTWGPSPYAGMPGPGERPK